MIKAVIFDFGGVLLRTHNWSGRRRWEQKLGLQENEAEAIVFNSDMGRKAQHGHISYAQLLAWVGDYLDLSAAELNAFETDFWAGDALDQDLVALIRHLRPSYQVALISNAFNDLRHSLTDQFQLADLFDPLVISSEVGIMKPDPRIYQLTLERLGCRPGETVFIDDFAHNIAGAEALGMNGILFKPAIDLEAALATVGVYIQQAKGGTS